MKISFGPQTQFRSDINQSDASGGRNAGGFPQTEFASVRLTVLVFSNEIRHRPCYDQQLVKSAMNITIPIFTTCPARKRLACGVSLVTGMLLTALAQVEGAVINARSTAIVDVGAAVTLAKEGDLVIVPAGSATWNSTLTITKNITLQGAGEAQTVIIENLPRATQPPLIYVSLSHDAPASQAYSFRLTGFTFKSAPGLPYYRSSDASMIKITGKSSHVAPANVSASNPAPYVLGCVSKVRVDHCEFYQLKGTHFISNSVLGVMDHCTFNAITGYPIKSFMNNWTPTMKPDGSGPMTTLAARAYGSWADEPWWGTDKFWFFEDCDFYTEPTKGFNVMDNEQGARVVVRHCTFRGGNGGVASHGMEGRAQPGIKQIEFYNNYLNISRLFAQHRSGSALYFNNLSTNSGQGMGLNIYRSTRTEPNWGHASGDCRYDENANGGAILYSGTVTATNGSSSITDSNKPNFDNIVFDGSAYGIIDKDRVVDATKNPGWKYKGNNVIDVSGNTLTLATERLAFWAVGHAYEIRKIKAIYGQPGQGKSALLNPGTTGNSYYTYRWPANSGTMATSPGAGYPLEPCYSWNNTDNSNGYLGFSSKGNFNRSLKANRDYFNLPERTISTQSVGYPAQNYTRATTNYPGIGPSGTTPYKPYTYPHPLVTGGSTATAPNPPRDLQIVP